MSLIFGPDIERIEPLVLGGAGAGGKGKSDGQAQGPTSGFTKNMMHAGVTSAGGARAGRSMSAAARDRRAVKALGRIARGSPEVMVRISGKQGTGQHSLANMAYISRIEREEEQHVELEDQDGKIIKSREDMKALSIEWETHEQEGDDRRKGAVSRSYVLSMPEGTDAAKVKDAARAFAREEFSDHKYVLALHTDTPRPHVHITVAIRDQNLRRHYPKRDDLARYRETFARELRARGIEANATPCKARGVAPKAEHIAKEKMRGKGLVPKHDEQTAMKESRLNRFDKMLAKSLAQTANVYALAVQRLAASSDPKHQEIAHSLARFTDNLPRQAPARAERPLPPIADRQEAIDPQGRDSAGSTKEAQLHGPAVPGRSPAERSRSLSQPPRKASPQQREDSQRRPQDRKVAASEQKRRSENKSGPVRPSNTPDSAKLNAPPPVPEYLIIDGKNVSTTGMDAESVKMIQDIQGKASISGKPADSSDIEAQQLIADISKGNERLSETGKKSQEMAEKISAGTKDMARKNKLQRGKSDKEFRELTREKDRDRKGPTR